MISQLSKSIASLSILMVSAFASQASAQSWEHVDGLASSIERKANLLISESRHYRHTPEYAHVVTDAVELRRLASHIHEVVHHHPSIAHLASDVAELDSSFHHMESVFDGIEHAAAYGHGHIHGNTSHVKALLNSIESDIHHLQEDLELLRAPRRSPYSGRLLREVRVYSAPRPVYRTYESYGGHGHGGYGGHGGHSGHVESHGSFTIGGGSSKIRIKF